MDYHVGVNKKEKSIWFDDKSVFTKILVFGLRTIYPDSIRTNLSYSTTDPNQQVWIVKFYEKEISKSKFNDFVIRIKTLLDISSSLPIDESCKLSDIWMHLMPLIIKFLQRKNINRESTLNEMCNMVDLIIMKGEWLKTKTC